MFTPSTASSVSNSPDFNFDSPTDDELSMSVNMKRAAEDAEYVEYPDVIIPMSQPRGVVMEPIPSRVYRHTSPRIYESILSFSSDSSLHDNIFLKTIEGDVTNFTIKPDMSEDEYVELVEMVRDGIKAGVEPERISAGSSGSYFVKNRYGKVLGVFKPKDEEPYSNMNPKWTKWIHRSCCPCCFGRSCIMVGAGFLSEAAASAVDRFLGLGLVPRTEIVQLGASTLHYSLMERWAAWRLAAEQMEKLGDDRPYTAYRPKIGSLQVFVEGYKEAGEFVQDLEEISATCKDVEWAFQAEFEKLVVLDYVIRNTDRSMDNLLVKLEWTEDKSFTPADDVVKSARLSVATPRKPFKPLRPIVKFAAIDNGLAFPYKHPDNWRSYPFGWAKLPYCQTPFSPQLSSHLLALLSDRDTWDILEEQLRQIFRLDRNFRERHFQRQMAVVRGQLRNLVDCLGKGGMSPADLLEMAPILIQEQDEYLKDLAKVGRGPWLKQIKASFDGLDSTEGHPRWQRIVEERPVFTSF